MSRGGPHRVDDKRHRSILNVIDNVRTSFFHFIDRTHVNPMRSQIPSRSAGRVNLKPALQQNPMPLVQRRRHLPLRHPRHRAAWKLASASMRGFRTALSTREFTEIATPKLVGTATESGANVFTVDYFGRTAYLAQSPQLYKQMLVGVFERVFEVGPVFRAEPHDTVRHLAQYTSLSYFWYDVNSGYRKNVYAFETFLLAQKYFLDGQLVWAGNLGIEADSATRQPIQGLPEDFEWPLTPEMEIAITVSTGLTYRIFSNWFVGAEIFYQTEHETVVGQERWSLQAGPTIHYAAKDWWATLTWMPQLVGGGTPFPGQTYNQQLIEKTSQEIRFKVGINF